MMFSFRIAFFTTLLCFSILRAPMVDFMDINLLEFG